MNMRRSIIKEKILNVLILAVINLHTMFSILVYSGAYTMYTAVYPQRREEDW
jgi:hypothetical protein